MKSGFYVGWNETLQKQGEVEPANVKTRQNGRKAIKLYCSEVQGFEPLVKPSKAFTLAEVLLTLAVIGIVAAITLPSLMVDTTEKAFDAQRKALHARLAQAIGTMANLSGYGEYVVDATGDTTADTAAETFLYEGLSKVYKMNNICGYDSADTDSATVLTKCNIPATITTMAGSSISFPTKLSELNEKLINASWGVDSDKSTTDTKVAAFETINGESIAVFYNLNCKNDTDVGPNIGSYSDGRTYDYFYTQNRMCVNFIYDLNGLKGPNKVGKDIGFITALYAKNPEVVAPVPFAVDVDTSLHTQQEAIDKCLAYSDDARLPNKHEMSSMFYNMNLVGNYMPGGYWTSSVISSSRGWRQSFNGGDRDRHLRSGSYYVRCVRK